MQRPLVGLVVIALLGAAVPQLEALATVDDRRAPTIVDVPPDTDSALAPARPEIEGPRASVERHPAFRSGVGARVRGRVVAEPRGPAPVPHARSCTVARSSATADPAH